MLLIYFFICLSGVRFNTLTNSDDISLNIGAATVEPQIPSPEGESTTTYNNA